MRVFLHTYVCVHVCVCVRGEVYPHSWSMCLLTCLVMAVVLLYPDMPVPILKWNGTCSYFWKLVESLDQHSLVWGGGRGQGMYMSTPYVH